jgi:hypothetical protein
MLFFFYPHNIGYDLIDLHIFNNIDITIKNNIIFNCNKYLGNQKFNYIGIQTRINSLTYIFIEYINIKQINNADKWIDYFKSIENIIFNELISSKYINHCINKHNTINNIIIKK